MENFICNISYKKCVLKFLKNVVFIFMISFVCKVNWVEFKEILKI